MACAEGVVGAFVHTREAADAAVGADGRELLSASGENLVSVGLMADIPDHFVVGGGEDVMQCYCQLDGAERRREMAGVSGQRVHNVVPQLASQFRKVGNGQLAKFRRTTNIF